VATKKTTKRPTPSVSPLRGMPVGEWIKAKADASQAQVIRRLIDIGKQAAPDATLSIKWGQPVFEQSGPMVFIKVAKAHVTLGFWRGAELDDGTLEGGDVMKHLKIRALSEIDEPRITRLMRKAVELNRTKGDPTKRGARP
jgi:hypothetical protein